MADRSRYTLDTSAMLAYFTDEDGADRVERILVMAEREELEAYVSFMTYMEMVYREWRRLGEKAGKAAYLRLKALAIHRVDTSEHLLLIAARLKASHDLSVADAWIAATAVNTASTLVHKDPEFRSLAHELPLLELPLKASRPRRRSR